MNMYLGSYKCILFKFPMHDSSDFELNVLIFESVGKTKSKVCAVLKHSVEKPV